MRYFAAVAEQLSFTKAAEILNISQPPLSRQIQELEEEIGTTLFVRSANKISLTKAGEFFSDEARKILRSADEAARATKVIGDSGANSLRIGCVSFLLHAILPPFFERVRATLPDLHLDVRVMSTEAQERALRSGDLDLGFVRSWVHDEGLVFLPLVHERLTLIFQSGTAEGTTLQELLTSLASRPFVAISQRTAPGLAERLLQICRDKGVDPRIGYESNDAYSIISMVAAGLGWSIVPDLALKESDMEGLQAMELPETIIVGLCHTGEPVSPQVEAFLGLAKDYFGQASVIGSFSSSLLGHASRE